MRKNEAMKEAGGEMLCEHGCGDLVRGRGSHDQGCPTGRRRMETITVTLDHWHDNTHTMALGFSSRGSNSTTMITVEMADLCELRDVIDVVIRNGGPL